MSPEDQSPSQRRAANVASLRDAFDAYMGTFLERRREFDDWVAEEQRAAAEDEYRRLQRRVVAACRPVRDLFRNFLAQEPQYDRRSEVYGEDAHYFEPDHTLTDWWSPLTFDEALGKWQNADDQQIGRYLDRQRAVLDAFADWAGEEHPGDQAPSPPAAAVGQSLVTKLSAGRPAPPQPEPDPPAPSQPEPDPAELERGRLRRIGGGISGKRIVEGLIVGLILLALGLLATRVFGDDSGSSASPASNSTAERDPPCVVAGQAFEVDGAPVVAAQIIARDPETYWEQFGLLEPVLATTDAEGRFEGRCDSVSRPFLVAVVWEPVIGRGEWCEWWGVRVDTRIEDNGQHRGINIQIPVEEVESGAYHYTDDYRCTYLDF